jgi:hypothetical protein
VHAEVAAAGPDVVLERRLLRRVEHVAGGGQPDDRLEPGQVGRGELVRVLRRLDGEVVGRAQLLDGGDAGGDGVVAESGRLAEHQDREVRCGMGRHGGEAERGGDDGNTESESA